ncbi:MAG TPA: cupin domain-containing protein [Gaiellaceae bacterium]|nr:cupin domain-containing protein [Gaiellaceae bacterium]
MQLQARRIAEVVMGAVVVHAGDVEARRGVFRALTDTLGVSGFRVNQLELAAGAEGPEHDHTGNGQEEVYAVVGGSGVLRLGDEEIALRPGHFVYCPPDVRRQMVAGDEGLVWIGIGSAVPTP